MPRFFWVQVKNQEHTSNDLGFSHHLHFGKQLIIVRCWARAHDGWSKWSNGCNRPTIASPLEVLKLTQMSGAAVSGLVMLQPGANQATVLLLSYHVVDFHISWWRDFFGCFVRGTEACEAFRWAVFFPKDFDLTVEMWSHDKARPDRSGCFEICRTIGRCLPVDTLQLGTFVFVDPIGRHMMPMLELA